MCLQYFRILYNTFSEIDIDTHKLLFEDVRIKDRPKQIEFKGIPFMIVGKKKIHCTYGFDRNKEKRIRSKSWKVEKVYIYIYIYIWSNATKGVPLEK